MVQVKKRTYMSLEFNIEDKRLIIFLSSDLRKYNNQKQIDMLFESLNHIKTVGFDSTKLKFWDSNIASVIFRLVKTCRSKHISVNLSSLPKDLQNLLNLALTVENNVSEPEKKSFSFFENIGQCVLNICASLKKTGKFLCKVLSSLNRCFIGRSVMRKTDFLFCFAECGYKSVGIVSLVSFMVGLILAFVGAIQLRMFGAQIYVASLVTIGMTRIMGAIMCAIIMAGRTGASYAANIGSMRVNEEIDALKTFGFSSTDFLILPRLLSLTFSMPILAILSDFFGIFGGAFVGVAILDISFVQYWHYTVDAFGLADFLVGILHAFIYGIIISLCGCYYGINCDRNAEAVGLATTKSVVSSIVIMIVITGILTFVFEVLGI